MIDPREITVWCEYCHGEGDAVMGERMYDLTGTEGTVPIWGPMYATTEITGRCIVQPLLPTTVMPCRRCQTKTLAWHFTDKTIVLITLEHDVEI